MPTLRIRVAILVISILLLFTSIHLCAAFSSEDFHVAIVSKVYDYDHYIPRNPVVFKPGSTIKLYLGVENVNINRAAAVDFVVIIKDPKGYVVYGKVVSVSTLSYKDKIYKVLKIDIPDDWIGGRYTIDAYAFDVLNTLPTQVSYNDLYYKILYSGETSPSISTIPRKEAPYVEKKLNFYISKVLPIKLYIFNEKLEAKTLPVGVSNKLKVSILNPTDIEAKTTVNLIVDGKILDSKDVTISARSVKVVSLEIPPLKGGTHKIKVYANHAKYILTQPIVISPLIYDGNVVLGKILNGTVVYSPNNYVLGSAGISSENNLSISEALNNLNTSSLNRESAVKMLTNILAYVYTHNKYKGIVNVALLKGSDSRAEKILPILLDIIKKESHAPIRYVGVRDEYNLKDVKVLFYVGANPKFNVNLLKQFFEDNGTLICDNPSYWTTYKDELAIKLSVLGEWNPTTPQSLYDSYYNLRIDKGIVVKISTITEIPTKFKYLSLEVKGPPGTGMPPLVNVSTPINITFEVKNFGTSGKKLVEVAVNGKVVFNKSIFLKTGQSEKITFQYIPEKPGSYRVTIPGTNLMQVFFVKSKTPVPISTPIRKPERKTGALIVALSAAILAILIIVRIFMRD